MIDGFEGEKRVRANAHCALLLEVNIGVLHIGIGGLIWLSGGRIYGKS